MTPRIRTIEVGVPGPAGPGGGAGGGIQHIAVPIAFDTPGLSSPSGAIPGVLVYTPSVGDIIVDGWIEVVSAFRHGVSPTPDFYLASLAGANGNLGLYANNSAGAQILGDADGPDPFGGDSGAYFAGAFFNLTFAALNVRGADPTTDYRRFFPGKFAAVDPLVLVVSDDGTSGGNDPTCDEGELIVHLLVIPA